MILKKKNPPPILSKIKNDLKKKKSPQILSFFGRKNAILGYFWPNYCIFFILKIPRNINA